VNLAWVLIAISVTSVWQECWARWRRGSSTAKQGHAVLKRCTDSLPASPLHPSPPVVGHASPHRLPVCLAACPLACPTASLLLVGVAQPPRCCSCLPARLPHRMRASVCCCRCCMLRGGRILRIVAAAAAAVEAAAAVAAAAAAAAVAAVAAPGTSAGAQGAPGTSGGAGIISFAGRRGPVARHSHTSSLSPVVLQSASGFARAPCTGVPGAHTCRMPDIRR
jgi:hypothetical protein